MMVSHGPRRFVLLALVLLWLPACSAGAPTAAPSQFADPFAYCAAVGTIDAPDARYTGPQYPEAITQGLIGKGLVVADAQGYLTEFWYTIDAK